MLSNHIIVSLDFPDGKQALDFCKTLPFDKCKLKIGKELFTKEGPILVKKIIDFGFDVFLDLKYHDIPNTVANACMSAANLGVWMLNVHACGGKDMLDAAKEAVDKVSSPPLLIAVTVLTSMNEKDLKDVGIKNSVDDQVMLLARIAKTSGLDGVVCSAMEANNLRNEFGTDFCLVTPGVRPAGSNKDDQRRVMTPYEAVCAGSNYLVIGRPIIKASDPVAVINKINDEIEAYATHKIFDR